MDNPIFRSVYAKDIIFCKNVIATRAIGDILRIESIPRLMDTVGILICLKGETEIIIDTQNCCLHQNDMCIVFPNATIQSVCRSCNFEGYVASMDRELFDMIVLSSTSSIYMYIKENPCVSLQINELKELCILCNELKKRDLRIENPFRCEISSLLANALFYEIFAIYQVNKSIQQQHFSRKNTLFLEFQQLVTMYYSTDRSIAFYASKICISPRYLSSLVKDVSGLNASECIEKVVIMNIQLLLTTTERSIQQISHQLNFINPSLFSKYFKRVTGMTPKEYRERGTRKSPLALL
jgi:AraC-like DNA-binding protein